MAKRTSKVWSEVGIGAIGAAIGGALAVLFTSKKGKQARSTVAKEGKKAIQATSKLIERAEQQAGIKAAPARKATASKVKATAKKTKKS